MASLASGVRASLLKSSPLFFLTFFGGKVPKCGGKIFCMKRGGGLSPLQIQQIYSAWEKRNNFIGSRCLHYVSYWRWKELTCHAVPKGMDSSENPHGSASPRWRNSRSMETKPNQSPIFMHRTQKPKDLFKKNFFFLFFLPCRIELNLSGNVRLERKITVYDLKNA